MTDAATEPTGSARPTDGERTRLDRFDAALADIGHRPSAGDRRWSILGLGAMAVGVAVAALAYALSTSQSDQRDVISSAILAVVGLGVVVAGAAVFVRFSLSQFLRFWMLRVLLARDEQDEAG